MINIKMTQRKEHQIRTSVCIAIYNGQAFLNDQIQSILSQLSDGDEIVVVDDASTDNSVALLESIGDDRIHIYRNQFNIGHVQNFSKAISLARGKYILMSDQDDVWVNCRVKKMIEALESDSLLVSSNCEYIDECGILIPSVLLFPPKLKEIDSYKYALNIFNIFLGKAFYFGCCMGFREELRKIILPIPYYVESHDLWIALAGNISRSNRHLDINTINRRLHTKNATKLQRNIFSKILSRNIIVISIIHLFFRMINNKFKNSLSILSR